MTTKKQRREQVAAKRAAYDEETRRLGLEAQQRERDRRETKQAEALREFQKAQRLEKTKQVAQAS